MNDDTITFYLPDEEDLMDNYTMAISDLYTCKECLTCKLYDGINQNLKCSNLNLKHGSKLCYKWRGIIENC